MYCQRHLNGHRSSHSFAGRRGGWIEGASVVEWHRGAQISADTGHSKEGWPSGDPAQGGQGGVGVTGSSQLKLDLGRDLFGREAYLDLWASLARAA